MFNALLTALGLKTTPPPHSIKDSIKEGGIFMYPGGGKAFPDAKSSKELEEKVLATTMALAALGAGRPSSIASMLISGLTTKHIQSKDVIMLVLAKALLTSNSEAKIAYRQTESLTNELLFVKQGMGPEYQPVFDFLERVIRAALTTSEASRLRDDENVRKILERCMKIMFDEDYDSSDDKPTDAKSE